MKFEVIEKTEQGTVSTIVENALEAQAIIDNYKPDYNVNVFIKDKDGDEIYAIYDYYKNEDGITKHSWRSGAWIDTINELRTYGGYTTEEVM